MFFFDIPDCWRYLALDRHSLEGSSWILKMYLLKINPAFLSYCDIFVSFLPSRVYRSPEGRQELGLLNHPPEKNVFQKSRFFSCLVNWHDVIILLPDFHGGGPVAGRATRVRAEFLKLVTWTYKRRATLLIFSYFYSLPGSAAAAVLGTCPWTLAPLLLLLRRRHRRRRRRRWRGEGEGRRRKSGRPGGFGAGGGGLF